jgi:hypothetical protein
MQAAGYRFKTDLVEATQPFEELRVSGMRNEKSDADS